MLLPHLIYWKGWGVWVLVLTVFWGFAVIGTVVVLDDIHPGLFFTPNKTEAAAWAWQTIAVIFLLSATSIGVLSAYRNRKQRKAAGPTKAPDEFMFVRLRYWPLILAACAFAALLASFCAHG